MRISPRWLMLLLALVVVASCATNPSIFSKRSDTPKKGDGSPAPPGPDQQGIFNFSFQTIADKSGYTIPLLLAGWFISKRRAVAAIDTCVRGMQIENCDVCQRHVEKLHNPIVNKRVAVVKTKMKAVKAAWDKAYAACPPPPPPMDA